MVHVMIRHEVQDYSRWRAAFDDAIMFRQQAGEKSYHIYRNYEDANEVTVVCDFETLERARKFTASKELDDTMKAGGITGPSEIRFLHEALDIRRSSAD